MDIIHKNKFKMKIYLLSSGKLTTDNVLFIM